MGFWDDLKNNLSESFKDAWEHQKVDLANQAKEVGRVILSDAVHGEPTNAAEAVDRLERKYGVSISEFSTLPPDQARRFGYDFRDVCVKFGIPLPPGFDDLLRDL